MVPEYSPVIRFRRKLHWKHEYWWYSPFVIQWVVLMVFSTIQYNRFALTHDFAIYWQGFWMIAHGHLNPTDSIGGGLFLNNHFELIMWPLSVLYWIWPHASILLYIQDMALVLSEVIAWHWLQSLIRHELSWSRKGVQIAGMVMLIASPALYWATAFDFHSESLMALTITGASYALWRKNLRVLTLWIVATLLCGDVGALMVGGLGLSALLLRRWKSGAVLAIIGLSWLFLTHAAGAGLGVSYTHLAPGTKTHSRSGPASTGLIGIMLSILGHPQVLVRDFSHRWLDWYANLGPGGFLAIFSPWTIGVILSSLGPATLVHYRLFTLPGFQTVMLVPLVPIGTLLTLRTIMHRYPGRQWIYQIIMGVITTNALAWSVIWLPQWGPTWIRVSAPAARALRIIQSQIPRNATAVVSQGLVGRFADRPRIHVWDGQNPLPLSGRPTYFVMAPYQGIHLTSVHRMGSALADLAHSPEARLIFEHHGVYLWRLTGRSALNLSPHNILPAWVFSSATGKRVVGSAPAHWYVTGLTTGNVIQQAYWREHPGTYRVSVRYASIGPINVQVWDATTGHLIAQTFPPSTKGHLQTIHKTFHFVQPGPPVTFKGWGLWQVLPVPGHIRNQLEVRICAKMNSSVNVYSLGIAPYDP